MRICIRPRPSVMNLQTVYHKHDRSAMRRVIRTPSISELFAQGIHDRLPFVTPLGRRVQFVSDLFTDGRRIALLISRGRWRFGTPGDWTGLMLRRWSRA